MIKRRPSKPINIGKLKIGDFNPIRVQGYVKSVTSDIDKTISEINQLEEFGCEIARVNVVDEESANAISQIKKSIHIPIVADVLFNDELIIKTIRRGADKIRMNPGKFEEFDLERVVNEAKAFNIPIRIGVHSGALPTSIVEKFGFTAEAMVEAAFDSIKKFEELNFNDIIVSLKSSDILTMIEANTLFAERSFYPIHIGTTKAGTLINSIAKSGVALGHLLLNGIGDTINITSSTDQYTEILAAKSILKSLGLREGPILNAGFTSRTSFDVPKISSEIEKFISNSDKNVVIFITGDDTEKDEMKKADIGLSFDGKQALIYIGGEIVEKVEVKNAINEFKKQLKKMI